MTADAAREAFWNALDEGQRLCLGNRESAQRGHEIVAAALDAFILTVQEDVILRVEAADETGQLAALLRRLLGRGEILAQG